jgi:MFS family permease
MAGPVAARVVPQRARGFTALGKNVAPSINHLMEKRSGLLPAKSWRKCTCPNLSTSRSASPPPIAAYVLAFALGLLPFGRLGDIVGRTNMFLIGVGAFTAASAFCGMAPSSNG